MNPPARLFFNANADELDRETIPVFIDEPDHFLTFWGLVVRRKKLTRPSATRWYLEALDFRGVATRFRRPNLQAQVLGCFPRGGQA